MKYLIKSSAGCYYYQSDEMSNFFSSNKKIAVSFSSKESALNFIKRNDLKDVSIEEND